MGKVLGLDLGTNSIGWAVVERDGDGHSKLVDKGVHIFKEGVRREKNIESPMVKQRTEARASRRHYFRRRLRKIELLKVLVKNKFCPYLSEEQLNEWKQKKHYPLEPEFLDWQKSDDATGRNPYADRFRCLTESLDFNVQADRYAFGRAMYHIVQRRGFLSNRKDGSSDNDGTVKQSISDLSKDMMNAGYEYLGEYFYHLHSSNQKVRKHYTARKEHYLAEFIQICKVQNIPDELKDSLERAIFYQRPLKSQKGLVGKCTFEKNKPRCSVSHPLFEKFRMLSFINNIRIKTYNDKEFRPLNNDEFTTILPLFYRKSKSDFDFEDIAKRITQKFGGKGSRYSCKQENTEAEYVFNYRLSTNVKGCPVTGNLISIFGEDWISGVSEVYTNGEGKSQDAIIDDIWHVLYSFDDSDLLATWAIQNLQLSEEDARKFASIQMPQDYASLSLKAIRKILPFLEDGYRYDESVFIANVDKMIASSPYDESSYKEQIVGGILSTIQDYEKKPEEYKHLSKEAALSKYLEDSWGSLNVKKLYHPSMIDVYQKVRSKNENGVFQLGSPRLAAIRNPMAMRSLFRLRDLVNELLREKVIDDETVINIEFSRMLNDANMRKAIERYQRELESMHERYSGEIQRLYEEQSGREIEPTDEDILKYQLWEEQNHICLYTGKQIGICDFLGPNPKFDIEHTIPRSRGGDNSQMNKTLCDCKYNRDVKIARIPSELANYEDVMARIKELKWDEEIKKLHRQIASTKRSTSTKEEKDRNLQNRHYLRIKLDYISGKLSRFDMKTIPDGFSNRQGVDIGIIGKYAKLYLGTVFNRVFTVKGATTSEFRQMWGLQELYTKKKRDNHSHHCIDAITIACIGKGQYDQWALYKSDCEAFERGKGQKPSFDKPWPSFTEDVLKITDDLLVSNYSADNMKKRTKKKLRVRGKIQYATDCKCDYRTPLYATGDSSRMSLHQQTIYGAISRDDQIKYVVRKSLASIAPKDVNSVVDRIVDDAVQLKVKAAIKKYGSLQDAVRAGIWMNEEKHIPITKVRIFVPTITNPIKLKPHRDQSPKEYKRTIYVDNDLNYCLALYENNSGKRTFKVISALDAAKAFNDKERSGVAPSNLGDMRLKYILKTGQSVLFYEDTPEEIYNCSNSELAKRLYVISGLGLKNSGKNKNGEVKYYGFLSLRHHQEARPSSEYRAINGSWRQGEVLRPGIIVLHTQFRGLVEGYDFSISTSGKIKFFEH